MGKMQDFLFTTVKAENFGDENEIAVTCKTCKETVNFLGSFETILDNRRTWIKDHSCAVLPNIHKSSLDSGKWSVGCN